MSKEEIEKAIEKLNSIVKVHNRFLKGCKEEKISEKEIEALETVLNYIKELQKERDGIYADYQDLGKAYYDSIPKQVIRDKIEELEQQRDNVKIFKNIDEYDRCIGKIEVLKELLEEE